MAQESTSTAYSEALENYMNELRNDQDHKECNYEFSITKGSKYDKIVVKISNGQRMVHCFVNKSNGDLLKADSWSVPAKHSRGSIYNEEKPIRSGDFYIRR